MTERKSLLNNNNTNIKKLSLFFATLCIIDVFGVYPIITLPGAVIKCGWFGIPLVYGILAFQVYTASLLGKAWIIAENIAPDQMEQRNRYPYAALAYISLGKSWERFVAYLLDFTVFAAGIPNIIIAAQNLQELGLKTTLYNVSHCNWILILGAIQIPTMWLGSPKEMKVVSTISVSMVISSSIFLNFCILSDQHVPPTVDYSENEITIDDSSKLWHNLLITYGIIAFQFDVHPLLLTIQVDMENKSKIIYAIIFAFIFSTCLFSLTTILVYWQYGTQINYNILQTLPSNILLYFVIVLVTFQLCFTSVIYNTALYQDIEDFYQIPREFTYKRCIIRTILMIISLILAESVPRFDIVMGLIGGTFTGPLMFILPALIYIKLRIIQRQYYYSNNKFNNKKYHTNYYKTIEIIHYDFKKKIISNKEDNMVTFRDELHNNYFTEYLLPRFVIVFGVILTVTTTITSVNKIIKYANFQPPCVVNLF